VTYILRCASQPRPRRCLTLHEALASAGHPDPADWLPVGGTPDRIVTEPVPNEWAIEAAGVAHELIGLLPVEVCARQVWSEADPAVICAVITAIPSPFAVSMTVAARLAAHYAVAGMLQRSTIGAVIADAFGGNFGDHIGDLDQVIAKVIAILSLSGIPTVPVAGDPGQSDRPWYLFTSRAISALRPGTGPGDGLALTRRDLGAPFYPVGITGPQDLN
jgi:hypothetical protein